MQENTPQATEPQTQVKPVNKHGFSYGQRRQMRRAGHLLPTSPFSIVQSTKNPNQAYISHSGDITSPQTELIRNKYKGGRA